MEEYFPMPRNTDRREDTYWQRTWKRGQWKVETFQICSWSTVSFQNELWDVVKYVKKSVLVQDLDLTQILFLGEEAVLLPAGFIYLGFNCLLNLTSSHI